MVNLALMDKVLEVNKEAKTVRVQAGIRVSQLVDALKEHGLTLQNFASIREQQIGGIIQVVELFHCHRTFHPRNECIAWASVNWILDFFFPCDINQGIKSIVQ
jgi:FAD binding domain